MNTFETFKDITLAPGLAENLDRVGFVYPTPIQRDTIVPALEGRDILGTAQTGTGKTGAFGIPFLSTLHKETNKRGLILAPTRELAAQIKKVLSDLGHGLNLRGILVVGGESFNRQVSELRDGGDYIIATPGRLMDHLRERTVSLRDVGILVLDEVDRMMDMGFIPQVRNIVRFIPTQRQTLFFSATLPDEIKSLVNSFLKDPVRVAIAKSEECEPHIEEQTIYTTTEGKIAVVLKEIEVRKGRILVFARTKSRTDKLARTLSGSGHLVVSLHGGKTQGHRKRALDAFKKGSHRIMVATDLAGRGIDITDIQHVINYDIPMTREDYIHRIGRTARLGKSGAALNLVLKGDMDGERIISGQKKTPQILFRSKGFRSSRPAHQSRFRTW